MKRRSYVIHRSRVQTPDGQPKGIQNRFLSAETHQPVVHMGHKASWCLAVLFYAEATGADPGILVSGGVKVAGRSPDQPTSETYILKSFFLQIRLILETLNLDV